jgi:hypothetical protein
VTKAHPPLAAGYDGDVISASLKGTTKFTRHPLIILYDENMARAVRHDLSFIDERSSTPKKRIASSVINTAM